MDYWAGSLPGSMKCECGVQGTCIDQEKWCNCDALHSDWNYDGGEISEKEYLPVKALHFGDTGTPLDEKEGRYSLGPLECDGDTLFDNVVTFRRDDAVIELPPFDIGQVRNLFISTLKLTTKIIFNHLLKKQLFNIFLLICSLVTSTLNSKQQVKKLWF